jgi:FixJ family two-component response regulator
MPPPHSSSKPLVAIVDDHQQFRRAMSLVLEGASFETKTFRSVVDFVKSGVLPRIHCLVLDVNMPGLDGFALQECIRATKYNLPIVFCSGSEHAEVKARAITGGAASFHQKPVSAEQLIQAVRDACNRSHIAPHAAPSNGSTADRVR